MPKIRKTRIDHVLELGEKLRAVVDIAEPELGPVTVRVNNPRTVYNKEFVVLDCEGLPTISMSEDRVKRLVDNPALYYGGWRPELFQEFMLEGAPTVKALRRMERGAVIFDWINPREVQKLIEYAVKYHVNRRRINRQVRGLDRPEPVRFVKTIIPPEK